MRKIIVVVLLTASLLLVGCANSGPSLYDSFAQCLTEKGVTMYGTEWCPHCKNQKAEFGNSFQYINYVDCDRSREVCDNAGVEGYPTWDIDGQSYAGEQSLGRLSSLSGCPLANVLEI